MRRCSVAERVQQESEFSFGILPRDAKAVKDPLLHLGIVDADAARTQLGSVEHQVIGSRPHPQGLAVEQGEIFGPRRSERMVGRRHFTGLLAAFE